MVSTYLNKKSERRAGKSSVLTNRYISISNFSYIYITRYKGERIYIGLGNHAVILLYSYIYKATYFRLRPVKSTQQDMSIFKLEYIKYRRYEHITVGKYNENNICTTVMGQAGFAVHRRIGRSIAYTNLSACLNSVLSHLGAISVGNDITIVFITSYSVFRNKICNRIYLVPIF